MDDELTDSILGTMRDQTASDSRSDEENTLDDSNGVLCTITSMVMETKYVLLIRTLVSCDACKRFKKVQNRLMKILPKNISVVELVHGEGYYTTKVRTFMHSRGGMQVPSIFLMLSDTWNRFTEGDLQEKNLTIDYVSSLLGITGPVTLTEFKSWLSDNMHRLYRFHRCDGKMSPLDCKIYFDMSYPNFQIRRRRRRRSRSD